VIYFAPDSSSAVTSDSLNAACQTLQKRFDEVLASEATVSVEKDYLRVELTRIGDIGPAVQSATAVGAIGLWGSKTSYAPGDSVPSDVEYLLTDDDISEAYVTLYADSSMWVVNVEFTADGAQKLADYSAAHIGEPLTIVQDGIVISSPLLNTPMLDGIAVISGAFDEQEAKTLAAKLNSGRLPFQLERVEEK
jgi:preprotein translocase subunit SecD